MACGVALALSFALAGCDRVALEQLEPGVSTEADVLRWMGPPSRVWQEGEGVRQLAYTRQPEGLENYMIRLDADGTMQAIEQVLTPTHFEQVQPGMAPEQLLHLLGEPAQKVPYALKNQTVWTWRYLVSPNASRGFYVTLDSSGRVVHSGTGPDPRSRDLRGA